MKEVYLYPGQFAFSQEPIRIRTVLGSCVGVALFDPKLKCGGLNHYLLPELPLGEQPSGRYGSCAIPALINGLVKLGADPRDLRAKIFGGAAVLGAASIGQDIGRRNIEFAIKTLEAAGISIDEQGVGGKRGIKIRMETETFNVERDEGSGDAATDTDTSGFHALQTAKDIKIVIIDDSATVRSLFQKIFVRHGLNVVGVAADAYEAREIIVKTKPDVITLDIEMPRMSGIVFLEKIMQHMPIPVVMVSSLGSQGSAALRALELGAIEFIHKPSQYDPAVLKDLAEMLVEKVRAAACVDIIKKARSNFKPKVLTMAGESIGKIRQAEIKVITVSGNTGSQDSLLKFLSSLEADTPPVVVAVSTIAPFLEQYLVKLKKLVRVDLSVAQQGDTLHMGKVYFAGPDKQTRVVATGHKLTLDISKQGPVCGQMPSGNVLLESAAAAAASGAVGILLSAFGSDGVEGLTKIQSKGGFTMVQDPSETEFPYAAQKAIELGVVDKITMIDQMGSLVMEYRNKRVA